MQKIPEWRRLNALGDAVTLLMIIGVITVLKPQIHKTKIFPS